MIPCSRGPSALLDDGLAGGIIPRGRLPRFVEPQAGVERQTLVSSSVLAYLASVPVSALAKGEGAGGFEVAEVISGVVLRGFENEGEVGEGRVSNDAGQSLEADLALAAADTILVPDGA